MKKFFRRAYKLYTQILDLAKKLTIIRTGMKNGYRTLILDCHEKLKKESMKQRNTKITKHRRIDPTENLNVKLPINQRPYEIQNVS